MADPFVAEIRIVGFNFAPRGWAFCDGQLMPISQNTALFSLLGTNYGGDGKSTFGLPDLQGSAPMFWGQGPGLSNRDIGEQGGSQSVSLLQSEIPSHNHSVQATTNAGTTNNPNGAVWAVAGSRRAATSLYSPTAGGGTMSPSALSITGGSQPHNNMPPYLGIYFVIAMQGIFPQRS